MIPDSCKNCVYNMHIYDVYGTDTGASEYHCENGRSVSQRGITADHIYSWCPHKQYEQMKLLLT